MKPGNLAEAKVPNPAAKREMRIRYTHIESVGVRFFIWDTLFSQEKSF